MQRDSLTGGQMPQIVGCRSKTIIKEWFDLIRCWIDVDPRLREQFYRDRKTEGYQSVFHRPEPLVSVCVGTYNRAELLTERCLPSILNQNYRNLEVVVVGDACTDDTANRVARIDDPRLRFVNLPQRGRYPANPRLRWMVAGTSSINHALTLARGDFITHLDDDDEYMPTRIEKLVNFAQRSRLDLVWHPFLAEDGNGTWHERPCLTFQMGGVTTSSSFYHQWFRNVPWDPLAYRLREPGDWNRFRKLKYVGVNAQRYPEILLKHFKEHSQKTA